MIRRETRRDILDHLNQENFHFSGRMSDVNFLSRLYELEKIKSGNYENAYHEIKSLEYNSNYYGEINWVFNDSRFSLLNGSSDVFLQFLCLMAHPLVREKEDANRIVTIANDWLKEDGWEIYPAKEKAGGKIYEYRKTNAVQKPKEEEVASIWEKGKLRFFISHRDIHKAGAKKLGADLLEYGISSFVAHDSIQAMSTWKHEIMKALQTMDACICYITKDFYDSEWTNQEVGFALARGIPVYLYSIDKTDPKGFKLDTQAIKTGFLDLISCIKKDFHGSTNWKKIFISNFVDAKDGSWDYAKNKFFELVGLDFNDEEIKVIAASFDAKAKHSNQLTAILYDKIKPEHLNHPRLKNYTHYREYLENDIFKQHSLEEYLVSSDEKGRFSISSKRQKGKS